MLNRIGHGTWWKCGLITIMGLLLTVGVAGAYNLEAARVEYRDYADASSSHTRVPLMFTDDAGNWVNPNVSDIRITYLGAQITTFSPWQDWLYEVSGTYDESTEQWSFSNELESYYYMRVKIAPSGDFGNAAAPAGAYRLSVDTDQGTITQDLTFSGPQSLPRIDASSFQFSYNRKGDLTITWDLPEPGQFPTGSFLNLAVEDGDDWHYGGYFSMPPTVDSITIPAASLALLGSPDSFSVAMRTQSEDRSTRVYSDTVTVQAADIPVESTQDGWVSVNGTVTYGGSPLTAMVLINGQHMFSFDAGAYELTVPLDGDGELLVQAFVSGFAPYRLKTAPTDAALDITMQRADPESKSPVITTVTATDASTPAGWARITGTVTDGESDLCAMVLANGQHMFSCNANSGIYDLTVPLDGNGQITLYVFAAGFQPYKGTFAP
jgi:hypothetical protein